MVIMHIKRKIRSNRANWKIPGTIEIRYLDEHGKMMFEWKRNRSGSNVEDGVYELLHFIKEKMSVDLIDYLEKSQKNINNIKNNTVSKEKES